MRTYSIAWWNLENLFDVEHSPTRPAWLQRALQKELAGWDDAVLGQKVGQLASIISQMNGGQGPDLLGVCEVENRPVLDRLVTALAPLGRDYQVAHHDTDDKRGIDVAFIFDAALFTAHEQFFHVILKRSATRDLFQVNFHTVAKDRLLVVIGAHWPSRSGGVLETEPYRILAAETLSYWLERIQDIHGDNVPILVMGDLNDEPFNRSVVDYALSTSAREKVLNARNPRLWNLMWPLLGQRLGTHYYDNFPNVLDQILVTRGLLRATGDVRILGDSIGIFRPPEMVSGGDYPGPIRFGRPSAAAIYNQQGFSDHYPVLVSIENET